VKRGESRVLRPAPDVRRAVRLPCLAWAHAEQCDAPCEQPAWGPHSPAPSERVEAVVNEEAHQAGVHAYANPRGIQEAHPARTYVPAPDEGSAENSKRGGPGDGLRRCRDDSGTGRGSEHPEACGDHGGRMAPAVAQWSSCESPLEGGLTVRRGKRCRRRELSTR